VVCGQRGGFINRKDMYNNDGGQGGARVYEVLKYKKGGGNYSVFYFAGKRKIFLIYFEVFT
jgi:hypothetical protein